MTWLQHLQMSLKLCDMGEILSLKHGAVPHCRPDECRNVIKTPLLLNPKYKRVQTKSPM